MGTSHLYLIPDIVIHLYLIFIFIMKSLLILGVLLCVALCVRSAAIETLEATEENIQPYVSVEPEPEVELELALPQEDQTAVIEEQLETGDLETLEAAEENIQAYVPVEAEPEVERELALPQEDQTAVIEEQLETERRGNSCSKDWVELDRSCYRRINERATWIDAEAKCIGYRATLASVEDPYQLGSIQEEFVPYDGMIWVGGYHFEDRWGWVDGKKFAMSWSTADPKINSCLMVYTDGMVNRECKKEQHPFLCKRPL